MRNLFFLLVASLLLGCAEGSRTFLGPTQVRSSAGTQASSALFELNSTTKGFLPPKLTTAQIASVSSPTSGLSAFNTTTTRPNFYDGSSWLEVATTSTTGEPRQNFVLNSDLHTWQRSTSSTTIANAATAYRADRWYVKNSLGTSGVITYSRITSSLPDGSVAAAQAQITTAPTVGQTNGTEAYYVLDNKDSLQFYNQTASLAVKVKALNNVTSAGLQFYYKTTEAKVDTSIGSEQTCVVTTGAWATCTISGQAIGTSMTTSGVVGFRIRIAGVSSGNTYDINNGFLWTQAIMTLSSASASSWQRAYRALPLEIAALQATYEKSWDLATAVGTATAVGQSTFIYARAGSGQSTQTGVRFNTRKIRTPTVTMYNPSSGSSGVCGGGGTYTSSAANVGETAFSITSTAPGDQDQFACHWVGDSDL